MFKGGDGMLWCWTNTCGGTDGETLCTTETNAQAAAREQVSVNNGLGTFNYLATGTTTASIARPNVTRFVQNDARMRAHDNLEFQPVTRNTYIIEDATWGEIWACLPDGTDRDLGSDGCVSMLSVNDKDAEPTGFIFDGTGKCGFLCHAAWRAAGIAARLTSNRQWTYRRSDQAHRLQGEVANLGICASIARLSGFPTSRLLRMRGLFTCENCRQRTSVSSARRGSPLAFRWCRKGARTGRPHQLTTPPQGANPCPHSTGRHRRHSHQNVTFRTILLPQIGSKAGAL
jgi:hypothetical protein